MRYAKQLLSRLHAREDGQLVIIVALSMVVVLGFAALVVDLGVFAETKREVQNDADAMALAGARELPLEDDAEDVALEWGAYNGVNAADTALVEFGETCSGVAMDGTVTVELERNQQTFLARVLGVEDADLSACATARKGAAAAGTGLLPIGFLLKNPEVTNNPPVCYMEELDDTANPTLWGNECVVKIENPSGTWAPGNTGGLRLDPPFLMPGNYDQSCTGSNNGGAEYRENIANGSECFYAVGDLVTPQGGSVTGPTHDGFAERLQGNTDTLEEVFGEPNADGVYNAVNTLHPRFGILPVITIPPGASGTSSDFTIVDFITVYIVEVGSQGHGTNALAQVTVIPVKTNIYLAGIDFAGGDLSASYPFHTIKLVE